MRSRILALALSLGGAAVPAIQERSLTDVGKVREWVCFDPVEGPR